MTETTALSGYVLLFTIYMGIDKLIFRHQKNDDKLFFCINPVKFFIANLPLIFAMHAMWDNITYIILFHYISML